MDDNKAENIIFGLKETIAEQKAEIERLTKENAIIKGNPPMIVGRSNGKTIRAKLLAFDKMKERNDELQKQVDELKETLKLRNEQLEDIRAYDKEIVKDTAKEIFEWFEKHCFFNGFEIVETYFRERFGVEVE